MLQQRYLKKKVLQRHKMQLSFSVLVIAVILLHLSLIAPCSCYPSHAGEDSRLPANFRPPVEHRARRQSNDANPCSQERLDSILRSCETAAATPTHTSESDSSENLPLFCGAGCSHLVFSYANECSNNKFLVNISGACKLQGENLTIEYLFAIVIVKDGISTCTKSSVDIVSTHNELTELFNKSIEYTDEHCCSLDMSHNSDVVHAVYINRFGRLMVDPPLEPPWQTVNVTNYKPVIDVTGSDLCRAKSPTTTATIPTTVPTTFPTTSTMQRLSTARNSQNLSEMASNSATELRWSLFRLCAIICFGIYIIATLATSL